MIHQEPERKNLSLRKNDMVQVIAGRDKGKSGKVLRVNGKTMRVTVEKLNMVKRHMKANQQNPGGGIIEKETPIHYSNVLLMCPKCNKGVRHGIKMVEAGAQGKKAKGKKSAAAGESTHQKIRVCKKCGESLESSK
jgi:large subunit ribosomal protein L24